MPGEQNHVTVVRVTRQGDAPSTFYHRGLGPNDAVPQVRQHVAPSEQTLGAPLIKDDA
jgi:hypothetical protein